MADGIRWVALDVHARESTVATFDQATGELTTRRVVGAPHELLPWWLRDVPRPARVVYEAGPPGHGLARRARAEGIEIAVCAPGRTDRRPGDRVKTDKRDAIRLARLLAASELSLVTVPSIEHEQLRDLLRCREDIRADVMRARHRLGKFLLDHQSRVHPRPLLIEAAYHYRRHPGVGQKLEMRRRDQPAQIINIAWRAQRLPNARWRTLKDARKKPNGIVAVAIARELAGFYWEIALAQPT